MDVRFHLDPIPVCPTFTAWGHRGRGGSILRHPGQDRPGRDKSRHAMGQTSAGRYLRVIYIPDEIGDGVFVVTAWEMRGNELRSYRRRRRR